MHCDILPRAHPECHSKQSECTDTRPLPPYHSLCSRAGTTAAAHPPCTMCALAQLMRLPALQTQTLISSPHGEARTAGGWVAQAAANTIPRRVCMRIRGRGAAAAAQRMATHHFTAEQQHTTHCQAHCPLRRRRRAHLHNRQSPHTSTNPVSLPMLPPDRHSATPAARAVLPHPLRRQHHHLAQSPLPC